MLSGRVWPPSHTGRTWSAVAVCGSHTPAAPEPPQVISLWHQKHEPALTVKRLARQTAGFMMIVAAQTHVIPQRYADGACQCGNVIRYHPPLKLTKFPLAPLARLHASGDDGAKLAAAERAFFG
jgi:hypothetical protein